MLTIRHADTEMVRLMSEENAVVLRQDGPEAVHLLLGAQKI